MLPGPTSLAAVASLRRVMAVAGTHGKTTTASMLALILVEAGLRPSFLIGGDVNEIGTNAVWDDGEWMVVEADESDGTFLALVPEMAVVTNVEADHLDHYGSFDAVRAAFGLRGRSPGRRVIGATTPRRRPSVGPPAPTSSGPLRTRTYRIAAVDTARSSVAFDLHRSGRCAAARLARARPGPHNARNAAVATVAALAAGAPFEAGPGRWPGSPGWRVASSSAATGGVTFVDDYAHLPTEVRAALAAARNGGWGRVVAVFQPHRYCGRPSVGEEFGTPSPTPTWWWSPTSTGRARPPCRGCRADWWPTPCAAPPEAECTTCPAAPTCAAVGAPAAPGDLCLTLGAGDLTSLPDELLAAGGRPATGRLSTRRGDLDDLAEALGAPGRPRRAAGARTTYRVGGPAAVLVEAGDEAA